MARGDEVSESKTHLISSRIGAGGTFLADGDESTEKSTRSRMNLEQDNLFFTHVRALWSKRAANFRRDKKAWCCTTILPSIFVLMGLLIFTFSGQGRDLDALELRLEDYNPDVRSSPRNPITVNDVNNVFHCQPGRCAYEAGNLPFSHLQYNDNYVLCGIQSLVNTPIDLASMFDSGFTMQPNKSDVSGFQSCSVNDSSQFMQRIDNAGVETIVVDASTVESVS